VTIRVGDTVRVNAETVTQRGAEPQSYVGVLVAVTDPQHGVQLLTVRTPTGGRRIQSARVDDWSDVLTREVP